MGAALKWLARHQNEDGSWGAATYSQRCHAGRCSGESHKEFDTGVTSLALLAFLGSGYTHLSRAEFTDPAGSGRVLRFGECVKKALQWLMAQQDGGGCVGGRTPKYMYNHVMAALALSEAYGLTGTQILRDPAQRAIDFLVQAQNAGAGWRYSARCGQSDSSVTGWAVMALKSAELSDLSFPRQSAGDAVRWYDSGADRSDSGRVGYLARSSAKVVIRDHNEFFDDHPTMSAVAEMARIFFRHVRFSTPGAIGAIAKDPPVWNLGQVDYYYWYCGSLALFLYDGPSGSMWKTWAEPLKDVLLRHQRGHSDGCLEGSWDPEADRWGSEGGRVYATAINALTLEVFYQYVNVFGVKK